MKRIISWVLLAVLMLSMFAGCASNSAEPTNAPSEAPTDAAVVADDNLANAIAYLKAFYKEVKDGDLTPSDFERLGSVRVGTTAYEIVYTVDCDETAVKIVKGDNGVVTIDVNENSEVEVPYALTATVTGTDGQTASLVWNHVLPISMAGRGAEIVDAAYALEEGDALGYEATLTGEIISIDTPYSADYKNITVTIKIDGREDKPIMCYRLKGEGADALMPGDIITVTGTLKNYKGTIEFDAGCILEKVEKGENSVEIPTDPQEILKAAFELDYGEYLPYTVTLTGKIIGYNTRYSEQYGNVTVTIRTGEPYYDVKCYRLKGEGVDKIWLDDEITVTGNLMNYNGTIEFDAGCIMDSWVDNPRPTAPSDPAKIMEEAYALGEGDTLPYYCYLTGTVTDAGYGWNGMSRYVTVKMEVAGKTIECYQMTGEDIKDIQVGDVITVYGMIKNYKGKIEFNGCQLISPSDESVVDSLYDLEAGESIEDASLTGVITSIDTAYSAQYGNITVTMVVDGRKDQPVQCYRLSGVGAELLEVGDTIQVSGTLTNYKGNSYQFTNGCKLVAWTNANVPAVDSHSSQDDVLAAAALLGTGQRLIGVCLTGTVTTVNTAYSERYDNITVTINANGQSVRCNRLTNAGVELLGAGDTIKVYGKLWKTSDGGLEFQNDCGLVSYTLTERLEQPAAGEHITIAQAIALGATDNKVRITATITSIVSTTWGNMYISDSTGSLYVYGAYDENNVRYDKMPNKPVEDGTYTFYGKIKTYNGTVEMENAVVEGLTSGGGSTGGGTETPEVDENSSFAEIAEAVRNGATLDFEITVSGKIISVYDGQVAGTKNVPVTTSEGQVNFNNMTHNGEALAAGDTISATGILTLNSKGKLTMQGCRLVSHTPADGSTETEPTEPEGTEPETPSLSTPAEIVAAAFNLASGETLSGGPYVLTGKVSEITGAYDSGYKNVTLNLVVEGKTIQCKYLGGTGADTVAAGDTITVSGNLQNYNGTVQIYRGSIVG